MLETTSVLAIAFKLFLITNPIGNTPAFLALLRGIPTGRQRWILLRETFLATILAVSFLFAGNGFMDALGIQGYTINFCGGVLLIILSLQMIFPQHDIELAKAQESLDPTKEPLVVPIATPLLTGGGLLTTILLYQQQVNDYTIMTAALGVSFFWVAIILAIAPFLNYILGKRGLAALEQFMGMVLCLLAIEILVGGTRLFLQSTRFFS